MLLNEFKLYIKQTDPSGQNIGLLKTNFAIFGHRVNKLLFCEFYLPVSCRSATWLQGCDLTRIVKIIIATEANWVGWFKHQPIRLGLVDQLVHLEQQQQQ